MKRAILFAIIFALAVPVWAQNASSDQQNPPQPAPPQEQPAAEPEHPAQSQQAPPTAQTPPTNQLTGTGASTTNEAAAPATFKAGEISAAAQFVNLDTKSSKFEEYRDVPDGLYIPFFEFAGGGKYKYSIFGDSVMERDRHFNAKLESSSFRVNFDYNQIPHRLGNEAHTLETEVAPGVFHINDQIQRANQTAIEQQFATKPSGINFPFLLNLVSPSLQAMNTVDLGLLRKRGLIEFQPNPSGPLNLKISYFQENRNGNRGAGTSFGFGNVVETPEPIDYKTRDLGINAELPLSFGLIRGAFHVNDFQNNVDSLLFDNPFRVTDATDASAYSAPGSGSIGGSSVGRVSLPPDNHALIGSIGALFKLPAHSRFSADMQMSTWKQNSPFIAYTTNSAVMIPGGGQAADIHALPERSLNGNIKVSSGTLNFSSNPIPHLGIQARYRIYDLDNRTDRIELPGYTRFDAVWEDIERQSVPYSFKRNRADVNVDYNIGPATFEAGVWNEKMHRSFRETNSTTQNVARFAGDFRISRWGVFRAALETGHRNFDDYSTARGLAASFVEPEALSMPEDVRRFDQAERDLRRIITTLQLTPVDNVLVMLNYYNNRDHFPESHLGLIRQETDSFTAEVDYTPIERLDTYVFYTHDLMTSFQRGRQSGATPSYNVADEWTAQVGDRVRSFGGGANYNVIENKVDLRLYARYQSVDGNNNLYSPPGGTPDFAVSIPQYDDTRLWTTTAEVDYKLNTDWSLGVGGMLERYNIDDAFSTGSANYLPGGFFLSPNDSDYRGDVAYVRATYHF